jgi:hypothetical protein
MEFFGPQMTFLFRFHHRASAILLRIAYIRELPQSSRHSYGGRRRTTPHSALNKLLGTSLATGLAASFRATAQDVILCCLPGWLQNNLETTQASANHGICDIKVHLT